MTFRTSRRESGYAMPHSRYIPIAERGWTKSNDDILQNSGSSSNSSDKFIKVKVSNNAEVNKANGKGRRPSSFLSFASIWQAPRSKLRGKSHAEPDERVVYDSDESQGEEGPSYVGDDEILATRERSNSMPISPVADDDAASYFTAGGDDLELSLSHTSSKRRSTPLSSLQRDYLANEGLLHLEGTLSRTNTLRRQRTAASLEMPSPISTQPHARGYPWRKESEGGSYIHPSHRNPTGKQAFYDTHFGSSSGWRSVAGIADDYLHPFDSGKVARGRWTGSKKEKGTPTRSTKHFDERRKESLLSWPGLQTLSTFGLTSSKEKDRSHLNASETPSDNLNAYEPELIPTIHRDPQASQYFKNLEGNIVMMGGYRGSILRDAETHQMMWVPLKVGVGLRRPTLEIDLTKEAEDKSEEKVVPDEMLSAIGSMVDMGKRLIHKCSRKKTKVYSWGYDWRLSLGKSSERLEGFLQDLYLKSAVREEDRKGAKVIAHSMGGLVALHALSRTKRPEIFESLIFASTPFLGTANILGPFRFGDAALFNDEICSPRATFSFRSSFYLLPVDPDPDIDPSKASNSLNTSGGRCFEEEDGTPHDLDFLDAETWNDLGFSPCVEMGKRKEVLEKSHKRAQERGCSLYENLQRSASIREEQGVKRRFERRGTSTNAVPPFPGPDMQLTPSNNADQNSSNGLSRREAIIDRATDGALEAAKAGQAALNKSGKEADNRDTLQPANRQEPTVQQQEETLNDEEWEHLLEDEATSAWLYLEEVLAETRKFTEELRNGFNPTFYKQGRYPPIAILTSGRTPTVRGALVANSTDSSSKINNDDWKRSIREGDYSRMLYAPGDGVILRKSATTLPGEWSQLLVRGSKETDLTNGEGVVETSHRHVTLLSDVDGIGRCLEACRLDRLHPK